MLAYTFILLIDYYFMQENMVNSILAQALLCKCL